MSFTEFFQQQFAQFHRNFIFITPACDDAEFRRYALQFRFIFNHRAGFLPFARGDQIMRYFAGNTAVKFRSRGDTRCKIADGDRFYFDVRNCLTHVFRGNFLVCQFIHLLCAS